MPRLGQHFLINQSALKKIAGILDAQKGDTVIEIGAGHGELTEELRMGNNESGIMNNGIKIFAIEKDRKLVDALHEKFAQDKNIEIIEGDVLKILPSIIHNSSFIVQDYKLVGNLPYYLTGRLLRIISELEPKPSRCVFTLQKEVAERLIAIPPNMNRLAASVQFWTQPRIIGYLPKENFKPRPKVDSAIVRLETRDRGQETRKLDAEQYYRAARILFQQPRKTILNNLYGSYPEIDGSTKLAINKGVLLEKLAAIGIKASDRPQNLSIEDIIKIGSLL